MTELLTSAQMRAIEQAAIASGAVTGLELMERAGAGVVAAVWDEWPELQAGTFRAVLLCGPGNNGGDGFVVARLLRRLGWDVTTHAIGSSDALPPDARANRERFEATGAMITPLPQPISREAIHTIINPLRKEPGRPTLVVDALFGIGLTRSIDSVEGDLCRHLWEMGDLVADAKIDLRIVAVEVPSGLCADSGRILTVPGRSEETPVIGAGLTVTFHGKKPGHILAQGPLLCGTVRVVDIGLDNSEDATAVNLVDQVDAWDVSKPFGHKYTHGHALILSGPSGQGGASRLAARGALRIGAGLVTVGCPPDAIPENASQLNAIMLKPIGDAAALTTALEDKRITAICLGPGLGVERAAELLPIALATRGLHPPYVLLDADALTALSRDPALFDQLHANCILTPHAGEFARLFPDIAEKLDAPATTGPAYSKVDATREAAKRAGCTVLFKGPDTVIADPAGRCSVNSAHYDRAAPWLATAGSGDVLAGFITGLLARGFQPMQAAETAAWLHVACARSFGPGLIAEDLPDELPKVFRALGL